MEAYEQVRTIGKGSFGVVTQIVRKSDNKSLVWKEVNYGAMSEKEKQLIVSEVNILRELRHPHIVRYLDRVIDKQATKIYIVMEYCEGGDLSQFIKRKKREGTFIEEGFIWHIFTHIYLALKECHRHREGNTIRPILHRDIKPGNIFLDANNNAKLGDFGLAKELSSESRLAQTNVGTPYYMSPEMVNEMTYDERSDIWALGCLLYEMATLAPPFDATNQLALAKKINAGKFTRIPQQYSEPLFQCIRWMLHRQRSKRPRVEDLERVPQLQQRLRAYYAASTPSSNDQQLSTNYNQKMKELFAIEEDLRRQEAALAARERKVKDREAEVARREAEVKKREQVLDVKTRKVASGPAKMPSPTTSDGSNSSADNNRQFENYHANGTYAASPDSAPKGTKMYAEYQPFNSGVHSKEEAASPTEQQSFSRLPSYHYENEKSLSSDGSNGNANSGGQLPPQETGSGNARYGTTEQISNKMKNLWRKS